MLNDGIISLGDISITSETYNDYIGEWTSDLSGARAVTAEIRLAGASTGTSASIWLQTSLDGGTSAVDIACIEFSGHTDAARVLNLSGLTPTGLIVPGNGELAADTVVDGIIGSIMRLKIRVVGTYSPGSVVSGRLSVR